MSKVRDISNLSNVIRTDASGNVSFVSGSTTLATINTSGQLSGSSPVLSSSYALNATSASYAVSASNATNAVTASFANAFTVANTLTAQTLVVQTITSSVDFVTGSTRFGSTGSNTHVFTGSVLMTGSLTVGGTVQSQTLSGYTQVDIGNPATGGALLFSNGGGTSYGYINGASSGLNLRSVVGDLTFNVNNAERMRISGSNVGIATTTISNNLGNALQIGSTVNLMSYVGNAYFLNNWYYDSSGNAKYITSNFASGITQNGSGELRFFTNASGTANATFTPTERLIITNGGNVGIGTTTPSDRLQVLGSIRWASATNNIVSSNDSGGVYMELAGTTTATRVLRIQGINDAGNRYSSIRLEAGAERIVLSTADVERFVISSTGAISTSSTLSIGGNASMARFSANCAFSSYTPDGLFNAASLYCSISTPGAGDRIRLGYNDYGSGQYWGRIGFAAPTNWSLGIIGGVGNDFSIGVGYQGSQLYIYANGNYAFSGSNVSDRRKKTNINYITTNQLDTILKLRPVTFNKISDEVVSENIHTGFIAQDIMEENIPNLVMGSDEGGYGLDYNGILALAVKAIQEQQAQINELKAQING
jgi:hypothetical protein